MEYNFSDIKLLINEKRKNSPKNIRENLGKLQKEYYKSNSCDENLFSNNLRKILDKLEEQYDEIIES